MSGKHLFKFQQENNYKTAKRNHLIIPNVSTVVESGNTYINTKFVAKQNAEAGDIIVFHREENGTKTVKYMKPEAFDKNDNYWTADAIVVVPYKHTPDGTVRAIGLDFASASFETGNGEVIKWGKEVNAESKGMVSIGKYNVFSSIQDQTEESTHGESNEGYCPSDSIDGTVNPFDTDTNYDANTNIIPSPYNNDGSFNEMYNLSTSFKEIDGRYNTEQIIKNLNADYLYTEPIENIYDTYPSTIACVRYSSSLKPCIFDASKATEENLQTMPWYQPSVGELGYYIARLDRIRYALSQIKGNVQIPTGYNISTSTPGPIENGVETIAMVNDNGQFTFTPIAENVENAEMYAIPFCKF